MDPIFSQIRAKTLQQIRQRVLDSRRFSAPVLIVEFGRPPLPRLGLRSMKIRGQES
jgi:hypothetical protein